MNNNSGTNIVQKRANSSGMQGNTKLTHSLIYLLCEQGQQPPKKQMVRKNTNETDKKQSTQHSRRSNEISKTSLNTSKNTLQPTIMASKQAHMIGAAAPRAKSKPSGSGKNPVVAQSNQNNSLLNTTLLSLQNQKGGKQPVKIGSKGAPIASKKALQVNNRAKSACKTSKNMIFNQTAPIKYFKNLEDSIVKEKDNGYNEQHEEQLRVVNK